MNSNKSISDHFKSHLSVKTVYKGGKTAKDIGGTRKVYKLSSNENPIGTSPKAIEAIERYNKDLHLYPDRTDVRLREALVEGFNNALEVDQFIAASSGSEILDLTIRAFIREGDEVIISRPYFLVYSMFSYWNGAKVADVPLLEDDYSLDVDGILAAITPRTRIIFLTSPNNPSGSYIPQDVLETFLERVPKDILVIFDEVYRHFADAPDYTSALPYIKQGHNILAVNSFSKTYGLASMRVGYCYTTLEIAQYIRQICKPFLIPILSLEAAIAALKDHDFVEETVDLVRKERQYLQSALADLKITYTPSQGNFILVDPPRGDSAFVEFLFENGIMVRPVTSFGAPGKVRITIGTHEANERLLECLERLNKDS